MIVRIIQRSTYQHFGMAGDAQSDDEHCPQCNRDETARGHTTEIRSTYSIWRSVLLDLWSITSNQVPYSDYLRNNLL